ncbi:P27 family phage terminase small subunit [Huintestinicola sp.]|uniref:P27 family phage terminase small subunit n=1 Tax=Huintestinicola sp. TaxID=2981661 RepID=UPI003D7D747B
MRADSDRHKERYAKRKSAEEALKGSDINIPRDITESQEKICEHIIGELEKSGILCSLDEYVLEQCAVAADCLHKINKLINSGDDEAMFSKDMLIVKEKYEKTFFKCCDELCLSPQSRAKIANINSQAADDGTELLKQILAGENVGDNS